jgi:hypothetical protein
MLLNTLAVFWPMAALHLTAQVETIPRQTVYAPKGGPGSGQLAATDTQMMLRSSLRSPPMGRRGPSARAKMRQAAHCSLHGKQARVLAAAAHARALLLDGALFVPPAAAAAVMEALALLITSAAAALAMVVTLPTAALSA